MNLRPLALTLIAGTLSLAAWAGATSNTATFSAAPNVFLRSSYDTDPSNYLGRFVADSTVEADDSATAESVCRQYIQPDVKDAGEVFYDEFFNATNAASLTAGLQKIISIGASVSNSKTVRVRYTLTKKMIARITDPAAYDACCKAAPDQCTKRYIGEYLMGTGATYIGAEKARGMKAGIKAGIGIPGLDVNIFPELEVTNEQAWYRGTTFTKPVYFAFKLTDRLTGGDLSSICSTDWEAQVPRTSEGQWFVAKSGRTDSEATARKVAMQTAREQVVNYLGEQITTGSVKVESLGASGGAVQTSLSQEDVVQRASSGIASLVKDQCWKDRKEAAADRDYYSASVLVLLPAAEKQRAAEVVGGVVKR